MFTMIKAAGIGVPVILLGGIAYAFASTPSRSTTSASVSLANTASNTAAPTSANTTGITVSITAGRPERLSSGHYRYSQIQSPSKVQVFRSGKSGTSVSKYSVTQSKSSLHGMLPASATINTEYSTITGLTVGQIQHLHVQLNKNYGDVDVDYHSDPNGNIHLDGHVGHRQIHLTGDNAIQALNTLISKWDVLTILQQILANSITGEQLPFQHIEIQTTQGTHIDLNQNGQLHIDVHPQHT